MPRKGMCNNGSHFQVLSCTYNITLVESLPIRKVPETLIPSLIPRYSRVDILVGVMLTDVG
jgi:hypothetical protein